MSKYISKSAITMVICCTVYAALAGCGTKGPLYIPEQRYPQKTEGQIESSTETPQKSTPEATTPTKQY